MSKKKAFLNDLSPIATVEREIKPESVGTISSGNITIGINGLVVEGKRASSTVESFSDLIDLNQTLGSGASGTVRKVKHVVTGKFFALKEIQLEHSEEFLQKKLVELKTLHASSHPNIVSFHGAFYDHGTLSFILEFMDRGTIADLIELGPIPEHVLAKLSRDILSGLDYLHKKLHLIHRDIKPQNILLNSEGCVKITDFGVSGEIANTGAFAKTFVGTVKYMSPSRIKGNEHSAKSDLWSAGLVILECALGKYPYDSDDATFFSRLYDIVNKPAPLPDSNKFSPEFIDFISLCLQKEEDKRPDCATLLNHPWIKTSENLPPGTVKEWLTDAFSRKR
eukprot:TRINITY_DN4723_c0_g1_i1.p1 TRINITY_DN4723_c0_g1~~TRINITY_DN4723_c0_g1_i1.p1  ORF type:complete len:337 (-),score=29.26 TRINITY_DN4723_c0_g1_i1:178-1188(-)